MNQSVHHPEYGFEINSVSCERAKGVIISVLHMHSVQITLVQRERMSYLKYPGSEGDWRDEITKVHKIQYFLFMHASSVQWIG